MLCLGLRPEKVALRGSCSEPLRWSSWEGGAPLPRRLERARELGFQEFAQLGCRLELRNEIQSLECRGKRIRETPDRHTAWGDLG
jgi:hypothetical protein